MKYIARLSKQIDDVFWKEKRKMKDLRDVSYLMPFSSSTHGKTDVEPASVVGQQLRPSQVLLQKAVTVSKPSGG